MSRTDKDMPMRVQATWFRAVHMGCVNDPEHWRNSTRICDLPPEPNRSRVTWRRRGNGCTWSPLVDREFKWWYRGMTTPPPWFVDHVWHNVERRRSRDECIAARKEYQATGDIDTEVTILQHRHCAQWLWW